MTKKILVFILLATPIVALNFAMNRASRANSKNSRELVMPVAESVEKKVNLHRMSLGLPSLMHDTQLCNFAQIRADHMVEMDWVNNPHPLLEEDHRNSNLSNLYISENVGAGFNEDLVIDGWLASKDHKKAIEDISHVKTCVATNKSLVVQIFTQK